MADNIIHNHPSAQLQTQWIKLIRDTALAAERLETLHPKQLELAIEQGWFKLLVPSVYTGLQKSIPELLRLEESISWADGSLGWVITLCAGAGWFGGFLDSGVANKVFKSKNVCLAGSGAATGEALIIDNGYMINGVWRYASGAHHATHFTANCLIKNENSTVIKKDGKPLVLPFIFEREAVEILPSWKYMGMIATGGDAFEVKNQFVPVEHCFEINPNKTIINDALYQYPFLQLAETTLAVNMSGMAIHFIDLCEPLFNEKAKFDKLSAANKKQLVNALSHQISKINQLREEFYKAVDASWVAIKEGYSAIDNVFKNVSSTSRNLAKAALVCVDTLYPYCGLNAANPESEINQVWRDIHTASQHSLLTFS